MKYLILGLLFLTACMTGPVASKSWPVHECSTIPGTTATYCYDESKSGATDVLFMLHGLKDNAELWIKPTSVPSSYPDLIAAMPPMRIFTISFGDGWMLTDYPNRSLKPNDATLVTFKTKIIPYLEAKYHIHGPYKGLSHSMGGNNLAMLWAAYPELWSSVTLINPALITDATDPWNFMQLCPWCLMVKKNYDNKEQWINGRPSAALLRAGRLPPLAITGCQQDILFHLYAGTIEFATQSKAHAANVDFHDGLPGCSHWLFDVPWVIRSLK